jgi:hypothetical protein
VTRPGVKRNARLYFSGGEHAASRSKFSAAVPFL